MANTSVQFSAPTAELTNYGSDLTGFSPYVRTTEAQFKVTTLTKGWDGKVWEYGKATAAIAVALPAAPLGMMVATTLPTPVACAYSVSTGDISAGAGYLAHGPFAIGEYGWVERNTTGI